MATELTSESTHDDIQNYVEEVAKDVQSDREGDEKSDAQITSEHADNKVEDTPADTGSDDTASDGETTGDEWLTDDLKAEVAAYGIDEEELADFTSREELERALRFFDKTALEAGRKAMAEGDEKTVRDEQGRFSKKEEETPKPREGQYEITLDKNVYDDELVDEFTRMRDHYESRLEALESRFLEADARAEEQLFDSLVDSLGHNDLFGKTGKENSKQLQRRQDLMIAVKAQQIGLQQLGRSVDLDESLVNRVARMVFAEDLGKKDLKARTQSLSKQSNGRMGGGSSKSPDLKEDPRSEADRLYREMMGS